MEDAGRAIEQAVRKFMDAFREGDAAAVASLYAEDARLMPPNHPKVEGADIEIEQFESQGGTAYEVGRYTLTIEQRNGERVSDAGKYVIVWKRKEGGWKIAVDIFNSDTPAQGRG